VVHIRVEQWCTAVPKAEAELKRRQLLDQGLLDRSLKPRSEGDAVLLPLRESMGETMRCEFEAFPEQPELPRHELIGGLALVQEEDRPGARRLLASRPSLHSVLLPASPVEGEYRTRRFTVLAGIPTTRTRVTEYGLRFDVDLSLAYFSSRLSTERQRILALMGEGERVLDMFAGIGPFAITLARKARVVFAADLNPDAVHLMTHNIALNRTGNVLPLLADAGHLDELELEPFDRIVMNLPMTAPNFLEKAVRLCRDGGHIHLYAVQEEEGVCLPLIRSVTAGNISERMVRTYSPGRWHAVYDISVQKR
jgi:tRNA (guanine37-N1)-methyltransferase